MPIKKKKKTKVKKKVNIVKLLKKIQKNLLLKLNLNGLKVV
jgi:hypothetical protein